MARRSTKSKPELLVELLEKQTVAVLRKFARLVTKDLPARKAELMAVIQKALEDDTRLQSLWTDLDKVQQAAIAEVVHSETLVFDANSFRAKYNASPDWGEVSRYGEVIAPSLLRLFFYRDGWDAAKMPRDLKSRLVAFVPPPRATETETIADLPTMVELSQRQSRYWQQAQTEADIVPLTRRETEVIAPHDLLAVLRLVEAGKVRVSAKTKRPTAATIRSIAEVLHGGDYYALDETPDPYLTDPGPMRAFAWPLIIQSAGLVELGGTKLQLTNTGRKALSAKPHTVIKKAWGRWQKSKLLDEFNRVHTIRGQTGRGKRSMTNVPNRRLVITQALQAIQPHVWLEFDEFSRFMQADGYNFEVSRDLWDLYIEEHRYGSLGYEGFGDWHIVQARYMLVFLFEYVATMGLIDVGYIPPSQARLDFFDLWGVDDYDCLSRYDGLRYLRLNNLGRYCLGLTDTYAPPKIQEEALFKVLPNLEVVITETLTAENRLALAQFATQTSERVWQLDGPTLLKSAEAGQSIEPMVTFLQAKSSDTLPQTVALFFQENAERVTHVTDAGAARLIETKDAALAQLLANDRELGAHCLLAGERHLVVPSASQKAFRRVLRKLGYALPDWS